MKPLGGLLLLTPFVSAFPFASSSSHNPLPDLTLSRRHPSDTTPDSSSSVDLPTWAGAGILSPPSGSGTFTSVTGTMTIPSFTRPANFNASKPHSAFYWVGIGTSSVLQTGFGTLITKAGDRQIFAWYEWFPHGSVKYAVVLELAVGDEIEMTVETDGVGSNGTTTVKNLSKGKSASMTLAPPANADPDDMTAEWIVEEYVIGGEGTIPFVDFGTVQSTG